MSRFYRIAILIFLLGWQVSCQPAEPGSTTDNAQAPAAVLPEGEPAVQVIVPANDIAIGSPRIPFIFYDGAKQVADVQAVDITLFDLSGEEPTAVWNGPATSYSDYKVPYWVVYPSLETAGTWGLRATVTLADGSQTTANFAIQAVADTEAPNIGEMVPASQNRTAADYELKQLSSALDPKPFLYQNTVAELIQSGRPAVISFTTPAYCQTAVCAPVLETVETVYATYQDRVGFVHLEIYKEFDPLVVADEVGEWGLPSEPWTFVLNSNGRVTARLAGPVSPRELAAALDQSLSAESTDS